MKINERKAIIDIADLPLPEKRGTAILLAGECGHMRIDRLEEGKTRIHISSAELLREGIDFSTLGLGNDAALRVLRRAVSAAYGACTPKVLLEAFPGPGGGVTLVATPFPESRCILELSFSDAGASSCVIERLYNEYNPAFIIQDGELRLLLRLPCAQAQELELRLSEFCECEYISAARAAFLTERYGVGR